MCTYRNIAAAVGGLYHFKRMPFGLTNGVAIFQREMYKVIEENELSATFPYLDNVYICGNDQAEHDHNLEQWDKAVKKRNITYNNDKCLFSVKSLEALGYVIENGQTRTDHEHLQPLKKMPPPTSAKALKRGIGLFSYYSQWIPKFSDKIAPLVKCQTFPIGEDEVNAFNLLKLDIENSVVASIDETIPFEVETDASDIALSGVLNQAGRPVAFFSRTLHGSELGHPAIEKEAAAIIESVKYWRHYLSGRHFTMKTDQQSVSYMFEKKHKSRIKNDKINNWRIELSCYDFDIVYRPGKDNVAADTFSRVNCAVISSDTLYQLHNALCHPGVTRMYAFVRSRNLPFSVDDVRKMCRSCQVCCECKPQFNKPEPSKLVKATQPLERLNIDFKGELSSVSGNSYILTIVDEYSRFPFAYPCKDMKTTTVIENLCKVFEVFGLPAYVHSDRGPSFMSKALKDFLTGKGIASSRSTPYNPRGNSQVERYNGVVWKAVTLALRSRKLPISSWEQVLPDALHSIRSLLCTSTNATPHERMFPFERRSATGHSVPTFLSEPGPVLLRKFVRRSKAEPLVQQVELMEANPQYAHIRYPDGRESTVSAHDLAPMGVPRWDDAPGAAQGNQANDDAPRTFFSPVEDDAPGLMHNVDRDSVEDVLRSTSNVPAQAIPAEAQVVPAQDAPRRSSRQRKPPDRLDL